MSRRFSLAGKTVVALVSACLAIAAVMGPVGLALAAQVSNVRSGAWHEPLTWANGRVPDAGSHVVVTAGTSVVYETSSSEVIASVVIHGTLTFSRQVSSQLDVGSLLVPRGGTLEIGSEANPLPAHVRAVIRLADTGDTGGGAHHGHPSHHANQHGGEETVAPALVVDGGRLEIHGAPRRLTWAKLAEDARRGSREVVLAPDDVDWRPGDRIVVSGGDRPFLKRDRCSAPPFNLLNLSCIEPTSFGTEEAIVLAVAGSRVTLQSPLSRDHPGIAPRQTEAALLTRNVLITSRDPRGRRGHVMVHQGGVARLRYVEVANLGRKEEVGRYPIHYHLVGNAGKESEVTGVAVWNSENLGVRVHGTNFLPVSKSVVYNVIGHGFSTENGTEVWNSFTGNIAIRTRYAPSEKNPFLPLNRNPNDPSDRNEGSGFWINNARNRLRGNVAADTDGWGFDLDPRAKFQVVLVDESGAPTAPVHLSSVEVLEFVDNEGHSNYNGGFQAINFSTERENRIVNLHTWSGRRYDTWVENSQPFTFENLLSHDPGSTAPYLWGRTRFVNSRIEFLNLSSRRHWGSVSLEGATVVDLLGGTGGGYHPALLVMAGTSSSPKIKFPGVIRDRVEPTAKAEIHLRDYDGPGHHVKLIALGAVSADTLRYIRSSRFENAQEASFTGSAEPNLALPLFIDAGGTTDFLNALGERWRPDREYVPSPEGFRIPRYGFLNGGRSVKGDGSVAGSARHGARFTYQADLPNGMYRVSLLFKESWIDQRKHTGDVGSRVFDVLAQDVPVIPALDVFKEADLETPLSRSFLVRVSDGKLVLDFVGKTGNAMVSAIAICPGSLPACGEPLAAIPPHPSGTKTSDSYPEGPAETLSAPTPARRHPVRSPRRLRLVPRQRQSACRVIGFLPCRRLARG